MGLEKFGIRTLITFLFGPAILFTAWLGGFAFLAVVLAITILALFEFYTITANKQVNPQKWLGLVAGAGICFLAHTGGLELAWQLLTALMLLTTTFELFRNKQNAVLNVTVTLAGPIYIAVPLALLIALRQLPEASSISPGSRAGIVMLIFLSIWICDSAAYIIGSRIGRHKLFPRVSPNKSIEGTMAGFLLAIITAWLFQIWVLAEMPLPHVLAIGAICGSFGQLSDLIESLFKRDTGVKDSSGLIPGHGGVLDRFDSELIAVPVVYFYVIYLIL